MKVLNWTPIVYRETCSGRSAMLPGQPHARVNDPMLTIWAQLRCLFCGYAANIKTQPCRLQLSTTTIETWESRTFAAMTQLRQQRPCDHCGFVSAVTPADAKRVLAEMRRLLTDEWAEAQAAESELPPLTRIEDELKSIKDQIRASVGPEVLAQLPGVVEELVDRALADKARDVRLSQVAREQTGKPSGYL